MPPIGKPDPYGLHGGAKRQEGAPVPPRPIDPSFDVIEQRGIHVITLLRTQVLDAHEIETLGGDLRKLLAKKPAAKVVLDLHGVHHLSSAALGMLLTLKATVEGTGGALRLAGVRNELKEIFKITKLNKVLKIMDNVDAAKASL